MNTFLSLIVNFLPLLIAIVAHEVAHGWAAYWRGDDTAKKQKRLSFNPLRHIDLLGTIVIPGLLLLARSGFVIGWAKPVPVNYNRLKTPGKDIFIVSSAGIIANLYLALLSALFFYLLPFIPSLPVQAFAGAFLLNMITINIILAAFNLLPIPPLDGSKIFFGGIRRPWAVNYINAEREGFIAIVALAFIIPAFFGFFGINFHPLAWYLINITKAAVSLLL